MRWYSSATNNYPYLQSTTAIENLSNVAFKAKVGNTNVKMDINYSADGTNWTSLATAVSFSKASTVVDFSYEIPTGGKYIKIGVSDQSTAPTSGNYAFIVDDVVFTYTSSDPYINADDVDIAYDATSGSIVYTIDNPVTGGELTAATTSDWLTLGIVGSTVPFTCSVNEGAERTASVVLTYTYNTDQTVTKNVIVTQAANPTGPGSQANPYTVAQARAAIDANAGITGVYATGIVSQVDSYNSTYNSITYWISDDGTTTNQLEAYGGISGIEGWTFSSKDDITVGATVVIYGNLTKYNTIYEFAANNQLVSYSAPTYPIIDAEETLTLAYDATSGEIEYSITNPVEGQSLTATSTAEWISNITVDESAVTFTCTENEGTEDRTATVTLSYEGAESVAVTVTQGHYSAPGNWVLTSLADLTPGDVFVIVGNNGDNYAMKHTDATSSAPTVVAVTVAENTLSGTIDENIQWNLTVSSDGYTFYPAGSATTWLYCISNNNGLRVSAGNYPKVFIMKDDYLYNVGQGRYVGIYNSQDWRSYTSINNNIANQTFAFYKKVSDDVTYTKDVAAYEGDGGYVLMASPVCSVAPSADNGFLTSEYDLYAFDQAEADEWRNYKASSFNLVSGKGYLYASSTATTLTFVGQPYNGNGLVTLDYTEGADFAGWNLIGNPFATAATLSQPFYRLTNGSEVSAESETGSVNAMEGVFVVATEAGQTVTFSTENNSKAVEQVVMNVTRNRSTAIDRAIVRFDEGQQLPKFQLNPENTKLYIAQGNKDYAIVRSAAQGEMPVSFRAAENGTYTLSIETENVEMDYLHLIDNMTGMDVDLLQTPSYSFEARKNDYTSRFRLVFSANSIDEQNAETFAYFNGSEWMVSNLGEATLQVVDVMGRVLSTETISGNAELSLNQPAGVYMLRLINGNDVKVQKVIVR